MGLADLSQAKQDQPAIELYTGEIRGANTTLGLVHARTARPTPRSFLQQPENMVVQMIRMRRQDMNTLCENLGVEVRIGCQFLGLAHGLWKVGSPEDFQKEEVVVGMALWRLPRLLDFDESQFE